MHRFWFCLACLIRCSPIKSSYFKMRLTEAEFGQQNIQAVSSWVCLSIWTKMVRENSVFVEYWTGDIVFFYFFWFNYYSTTETLSIWCSIGERQIKYIKKIFFPLKTVIKPPTQNSEVLADFWGWVELGTITITITGNNKEPPPPKVWSNFLFFPW